MLPAQAHIPHRQAGPWSERISAATPSMVPMVDRTRGCGQTTEYSRSSKIRPHQHGLADPASSHPQSQLSSPVHCRIATPGTVPPGASG
jgi:hypothetical protein